MRYYETATSTGLYRTRDNIIFGVVGGIAEHLDISVFWSRAIVTLLVLCTGFFPFAFLYLVAALVMKKDPYYRY